MGLFSNVSPLKNASFWTNTPRASFSLQRQRDRIIQKTTQCRRNISETMGLFGEVPRDNSDGVWTNASNQSGNETCGGRAERRSTDSMTSQESCTMGEPSSSAASAPPPPAASRIRELERQLRRREAEIFRLRRTAEAREEVQSARVASLERQLERLVESPSRGRDRLVESLPIGATMGSDGGAARKDALRRGDRADSEAGRRGDDSFEVAALEELLARVIAERDRFGFENDSLKSLLRRRRDAADRYGGGGATEMPPSIGELDEMINKEHKKNRRSGSKCRGNLDAKDKGVRKHSLRGCKNSPASSSDGSHQ